MRAQVPYKKPQETQKTHSPAKAVPAFLGGIPEQPRCPTFGQSKAKGKGAGDSCANASRDDPAVVVGHGHNQGVSTQNFFSIRIQTDLKPATELNDLLRLSEIH